MQWNGFMGLWNVGVGRNPQSHFSQKLFSVSSMKWRLNNVVFCNRVSKYALLLPAFRIIHLLLHITGSALVCPDHLYGQQGRSESHASRFGAKGLGAFMALPSLVLVAMTRTYPKKQIFFSAWILKFGRYSVECLPICCQDIIGNKQKTQPGYWVTLGYHACLWLEQNWWKLDYADTLSARMCSLCLQNPPD